jgi:uncharacterized protein with PIN domain
VEATPGPRVVLDAYPLVALLRDEPCAGEVMEILDSYVSVTSTVTLGELVDVLVRRYEEDVTGVEMVVASLLQESVAVEPPTVEAAVRAGLRRARWYRRRAREVSLGDTFVLAAARPGDAIATADPVLAEIARAEGVDVKALPDSSGRRP